LTSNQGAIAWPWLGRGIIEQNINGSLNVFFRASATRLESKNLSDLSGCVFFENPDDQVYRAYWEAYFEEKNLKGG